MPLVRIQTNADLDTAICHELMVESARIVAQELGKPESIMMAVVEPRTAMTFGGTIDPTALFEIEGIELEDEPAGPLCEALSDLIERIAAVPAQRVFVKLANVPRGYWAGSRRVF